MENAQALVVMNLTRRQRDLFEHLLHREQSGRRPPTLAELCSELGLRSRGSLHKHIRALVAQGLVHPLDGLQRGVRLVQPANPVPTRGDAVPLLGVIAAGLPIEAIPDPDSIFIPEELLGQGPCFVLRVRGDSMVEDGILDGDWVVIEKRSYARNGEIVVALVDGTEATLKRIEQHADRILLHPSNSRMEPIVLRPEQVTIQGILVGQMRSYR